MRSSLLVLSAVAIIGCSKLTEMPGTAAFDVALSASKDGVSALGDSITIRLVNRGTSPAYFIPCGNSPYFTVSKFENGQWVPGIGVACPLSLTTGPVVLAGGSSLVFARYFSDPGLFRVEVSVSQQTTLEGSKIATSNSIEIK